MGGQGTGALKQGIRAHQENRQDATDGEFDDRVEKPRR